MFKLKKIAVALSLLALPVSVLAVPMSGGVVESSFTVGLEGVGTISDGVDSVASNWAITAQTLGGTFSWSASNDAVAPGPSVSEPGAFGLASFAMLLFSGVTARMKKQKSAA